jgi:ABC-2 type transport system permease protein
MIRLVKIELLKLRTTPAVWVTAVLTLLLVVVPLLTTVLLAGRPGTAPLGSVANVSSALAIGAATSIEMLVLGIMMTAGEERYRTSLTSFLAEPRRSRVLFAKLLTACILGTLSGAVAFGTTLALAIPLYASRGVSNLPVNVPALWVGTALVTGCYGLLGVALGAVTRNSVTALVVTFVWVAVIEASVLVPLFPDIARWLPTRAGVALTSTGQHGATLLHPVTAAVVLVAWAAAVSLIANYTTQHREPR